MRTLLSILSKLLGKLSIFCPKELSWRGNVMSLVLCIAALVVLEFEMFDLFSLSIVAAFGIAIGFLVYFPRLAILIAVCAGCVFLFRNPNQVQHWQWLLIVLGFAWITWVVHTDDVLISQQLDSLHEKIDRLHERIYKIEANLDSEL
jgi:hypothetical protein